jgi:hypothetical protein
MLISKRCATELHPSPIKVTLDPGIQTQMPKGQLDNWSQAPCKKGQRGQVDTASTAIRKSRPTAVESDLLPLNPQQMALNLPCEDGVRVVVPAGDLK